MRPQAGFLIQQLPTCSHSQTDAPFTPFFLQDLMEKALEEQRSLIKQYGEELTYDVIGNMKFLNNVINEVLRLHPPLIILLRMAKKSFPVETSSGKTYEIPKVRPCEAKASYSADIYRYSKEYVHLPFTSIQLRLTYGSEHVK